MVNGAISGLCLGGRKVQKGKRCKEEVVLGLGSMRGECIALPYMYSTIM